MIESDKQTSKETETNVSLAQFQCTLSEKVMNPWFRLVLYCFMIVVGGTIYWGWNGIQTLLYKAGSFEDLCDGENDITYVIIGGDEYIDCGKRKSGINNLFTIAYSAHFVFTIVNGFMLDHLGPRWSYMICQICNCISWVLIGLFSKNSHVLRFAFFLLGSTAEGTVMPLITVTYFFKKHRSLIICITGSAISICYVIPLILAAIYSISSLKPTAIYLPTLGYALFGNFLCFLLGLLFVHNHLPNESEDNETRFELSTVVEPQTQNTSLSHVFVDFRKKFRKIIKKSKFYEYILLLLCTSIFLRSLEFINKAQREILTTTDGKDAVEIFKYIQFLSFIPTPFFGLLMDRFGPEIVNFILYLSALVFFLLVIADNYVLKVLAVFSYFLAASSCISGIYTHVSKRFPSAHFGTLSGIVMLSSGLFTLTNIPLYNYATKKTDIPLNERFLPSIYILISNMVITMIMSSIVIYISRRDQKSRSS